MNLTKIVIGGSCRGKSAAMLGIQSVFVKKGHTVLFSPRAVKIIWAVMDDAPYKNACPVTRGWGGLC